MGNVVNLSKGSKVNLSKHTEGLKDVMVGLGWDPAKTGLAGKLFGGSSKTIDCDACAVMLQGGSLKNSKDIVYFGSKTHQSGSVIHQGDNLTGDGDGDDEQILINLNKVPDNYDKIVLFVNIYNAKMKGQNFGQIANSFIRLVNNTNHSEMCRFDISKSDDYNNATAIIFGELVRVNNEWEFKALGEPANGSVSDIAKRYK